MTRQLVVLSALRPMLAECVQEALDGGWRMSQFALPTGGGIAALFVPIELTPALAEWLQANVGPMTDENQSFVEPESN